MIQDVCSTLSWDQCEHFFGTTLQWERTEMSEQVTSTLHVETLDPERQRRRTSCSLLTRYLLEEYAKRENEAAMCKTRYEKAYIGAYGSKQPVLGQALRDVLPLDSTSDLFRPWRRDSCPAFVSFFGWIHRKRAFNRRFFFIYGFPQITFRRISRVSVLTAECSALQDCRCIYDHLRSTHAFVAIHGRKKKQYGTL